MSVAGSVVFDGVLTSWPAASSSEAAAWPQLLLVLPEKKKKIEGAMPHPVNTALPRVLVSPSLPPPPSRRSRPSFTPLSDSCAYAALHREGGKERDGQRNRLCLLPDKSKLFVS